MKTRSTPVLPSHGAADDYFKHSAAVILQISSSTGWQLPLLPSGTLPVFAYPYIPALCSLPGAGQRVGKRMLLQREGLLGKGQWVLPSLTLLGIQ